MAEVIKGLGIRWGAQGITMTAGIVSATNGQKVQSIDFERTSDKGEIKNDVGEVVGQVFYNGKKTLRLTVIPSGATISAAQSSVDAHLIAPGTKITVVDANGTILDGDYNLLSAKARGQLTEGVMVDLEMEKYDANDVTATIS
jgi:hypothetical protein